ncbi:prephenate dehydrogenase/arogenate dehydrogenase family protein [Candidatus Poriferisodalis sp.]|uniref:prephenate dehydrogenase/arogenate dehydrogenase family protein n=1 Tax=Candidatus Poriferisodalis sp. TaxID=3101277 RepID=UPI003D152535
MAVDSPSNSHDASSPKRAQVVGTGLIGGSVAAALRKSGWHVTGRDEVVAHAQRALELGCLDAVGTDTEASFWVVAVPTARLTAEVKRALAHSAAAAAVVTDTGSVKTAVSESVSDPRFVPGHPMAGSEQEGVDGANPDMFAGAVWTLTPTDATDDHALRTCQRVLAAFGSDVVTMTPQRHDALVAVVSHVPHLTAASLMCLADDRALDDAPLLRLAAGGFRDMTRIAAGHPGIWLDICGENRDAIVSVLDELAERLAQVRDVVATADRDGLRDVLTQARRARTNLPSRYVRPQELLEVRVPIPDRKGQIAAITMLAADCDVNVADIEVAHSPEGSEGVLVLVVARTEAQRFLAALAGQGYHPTTRDLA